MVQAGEKRADVYLSLGAAYLDANRLDEGLETLSQATHLDPARPDIRIQLARGYRLKGQLDKAEAQLKMAAPQGPASVASPFVQERQVEYERYLELGLLKQQQGQARGGRRRLSQGAGDGSGSRAHQPQSRGSLFTSGPVRPGPRVRDPGREAGITVARRQAQAAAGRTAETGQETGNGRAEVNALKWFAPLLVTVVLLHGHTVGPDGQTQTGSPGNLRRRDREIADHVRPQVRSLSREVHGRDLRLGRRLDRLRQRRLPGSLLRERRTWRRQRPLPQQQGRHVHATSPRRRAWTGAAPARRAYKTGVAVGDYDNNGYLDLFVTSFGPDILYKNNGDGTFTDVTAAAGVAGGASEWSTSTGFLDFDRDGDLDLYVANYLDFRLNDNPFCGLRKDGYRMYCHPTMFDGMADRLFRNNGNGTFTDVSRAAGIANPAGKGLGVTFCDFDRDGDPDIYVANDMVRNFLYRNNGNGTFTDVAYAAGVGFDGNGKPQAGMGVDCGGRRGQRLPGHLRHQLLRGVEYALQQPRRGALRGRDAEGGAGRRLHPARLRDQDVRRRQRRRPRHSRHERTRHRQRQALSTQLDLRAEGSAVREHRRRISAT